MSKFKKALLMVTSCAVVAALAITGTVAYLKDEDSDVNVMTMGNVTIDQLEYERVVDADGNWVSAGKADKYGYTPDKVQAYTQAKPLYPAVFADGDIKWDDRNGSQAASGEGSHQQSWAEVGASGSNQLFDDSVKNAQDKFVFVKNTGKSDAYVRTWFAFEQGAVAAEDFENVIMTNTDKDHWSWETVDTDVEIDGNKYFVVLATYLGPKSNPTGILAPGAVSYPSLLQVYMRPEATNEDVAAIDGNKNGTYDILVLSQAIQTAGFEAPATTFSLRAPATAAEVALIEGFGTAHPWADGVKIPAVVSNADDLAAALANGGDVILANDIVLTAQLTVNKDVKIDLNGHELKAEMTESLDGVYDTVIRTEGAAKMSIVGDGDVNIADGVGRWIRCVYGSTIDIYGGNWVQHSDDFNASSNPHYCEGVYANEKGNVNIYGGVFDFGTVPYYTLNESRGGQIIVYGGTFINFNPSKSAAGDGSYVAEGYKVVSETQANGDVWYTVVAE